MSKAVALLFTLLCAASGAVAEEPADPIVAEAVGKHTYVIAEFVSRTCPACREMAPVVDAAIARHQGIVPQLHDADREVELSKKYDVKCVPVYVVVDPKGRVKFNDVGSRTDEEFDEILKAAGVRRR